MSDAKPPSAPTDHQAPTSARAVIVPQIKDIAPDVWNTLAQPDPATANPFVSHEFLASLEASGAVGGQRTGWSPAHLVLETAAGAVCAAAPMYVKAHSQGEYVFDHAWADALQRAGRRYYPKLQIAVPFTPVPGPRFLVGNGPDAPQLRASLAHAAIGQAKAAGVSSLHATFAPGAEWRELPEVDHLRASGGLLQRIDQQYHWRNAGYATFDDFLGQLSSAKRKMMRKERIIALSAGLTIAHVTGREITEAHWDAFFAFYMDTGSRKWGRPYLNRRFFSELSQRMADRCLLVFALRGGQPIAGALNLIGGDCLYGRYWGAIEQHPCLHFEICYYQAIDYAIAHGLARVEAGAQGDHKLARGYVPTETYSLHWIADPDFRKAIARFLTAERAHVREQTELLAEHTPFRKTIAASEA